jgi:hypothetical protein
VQTQFLVTRHQVVAPPIRDRLPFPPHHTLPGTLSTDIYAQILCEGAGGERLVLNYLRPGTAMPWETQARSRHLNRWNAATRSGVAFFPACQFAGHKRLVEPVARPMSRTLTAEVDDANPRGIRLFHPLSLVSSIGTPVPDLRAWLWQNSAVLRAINWWLDTVGNRDFSAWPATRQPGQLVNQQDLIDAFALAWQQLGPDLDDPPPNLSISTSTASASMRRTPGRCTLPTSHTAWPWRSTAASHGAFSTAPTTTSAASSRPAT